MGKAKEQETEPTRPNRRRGKGKRVASAKDLKQAERVKKLEQQKQDTLAENERRKVQGKKLKALPGAIKPSIWERMAEEELYRMLRHMGDSTKAIDKFQKKRVTMSVLSAAVGIVFGKLLHEWLYLTAIILPIFVYVMQGRKVASYYRIWRFERHLNFSKFTRLIIPYLKASGSTALYTTFNKILIRTEKQADKDSLYQLMGEMGDDPTSIQPFEDFAERSSGSDMASLFMQTIFDFQQSTSDPQVIQELGDLASRDLMNSIDDIIAMKLRRFAMFPTKIVMTTFVLVAGLAVGIVIDNFKDLNFGGADIKEAKDAGSGTSTDTKPVKKAETPEEQMAAKDAATKTTDIAKAKTTPKAPTKPVTTQEETWESDIEKIAKTSGTKRDKFYALSASTGDYTFPESDVETFKNDIYETYTDGSYIKSAPQDETLTNIFKAQIVFEAYDKAKQGDAPMRQAAFDYWANAKFIYVGDNSRTDALIKKNAKAIEKNLDAWRIEQGFAKVE